MAYKIPKLTNKEIETLQVDAAVRMMGKLTHTLIQINQESRSATCDLGQARLKVDQLKNDKSTVIELLRAIKVMIQSG